MRRQSISSVGASPSLWRQIKAYSELEVRVAIYRTTDDLVEVGVTAALWQSVHR